MLSLTELTQEQIDALQEYVDSLDRVVRQRGQRYFEKDQVTVVEPSKRGIGFRAEVMGGKLYHVKFRFWQRANGTGYARVRLTIFASIVAPPLCKRLRIFPKSLRGQKLIRSQPLPLRGRAQKSNVPRTPRSRCCLPIGSAGN